MKAVFADTFYFLALLNPSDRVHGNAVAFTSGYAVRMATTDWVLTELADGPPNQGTDAKNFWLRRLICKPMRTLPLSLATARSWPRGFNSTLSVPTRNGR
jgi:hypothetical protein